MSIGELWKGVAISAIIAIVFGVIGGHLIYNALEMVGLFGEELGANERSRLIYAESHRWVHLFAAACGLALGWFLNRRNWWLFTFALLAIFSCGAYGIQNMYGFAVKNRVSVAVVKTEDKAAANRQYENARKDLQSQIAWLQGTVHEATGREKRRLEAQVDAKRKELSALKPPVVTADNAIADTSATGLSTLFGISSETWTFGLPLALAVLMFLGESFSFVVVGHMLAAIVALFAGYSVTKDRKLAGSPEGGGGKPKSSEDSKAATVAPRGETVVDFPARVGAQAAPEPPPKVSAEQPRVSAPAVPRNVPLTLQPKQFTSVEEFLAANPSGSKQKDIADALRVSEAKVSRDIKRLKGRGKVKVDQNGRTNSVTLAPRRIGGGLQVIGH